MSGTVNPIMIIALAFGIGLGLALIGYSFFNRKKLPKGMMVAFTVVGVCACVSAVIMMVGMLL